MIDRYSTKEMKEVWSLKAKFSRWLKVEILICEAQAKFGIIPQEAFEFVKDRASFSAEKIAEYEKVTRHDVVAFIKSVEDSLGEYSRYFHYGVTSSDIVDTALSLAIQESFALILRKVGKLRDVLYNLAIKYKDTPCIGRTHGIHAEPITFGVKLLNYVAFADRVFNIMQNAKEQSRVGCISGAVGTYTHIPPQVEEYVCHRLNLRPMKVSTQVLPRDIHAFVIFSLAMLGSLIEKISLEMRLLQRTETDEIQEGFFSGQTGSSAMPHKKNPVNFEQMCGLARVLRNNINPALENISLWHERDISHSSVERIIIPDSFILADFTSSKIVGLLKNMKVKEENMKKNIRRSKDVYFSQKLLLELCKLGISRSKAYQIIQKISFEAQKKPDKTLKEIALQNETLRKIITPKKMKEIFNEHSYYRYIDYIFKRFTPNTSNT